MTKFTASAMLLVSGLMSTVVAQTLLVLNKEGNVAIVDPKSQTVLGRAPTGDGPHEVVATTDGKLAVASNYGTGQNPGHTLSVIDIATNRVDWMLGTGQDGTHMVALSKDRNLIFTSNIRSGTITIFYSAGNPP